MVLSLSWINLSASAGNKVILSNLSGAVEQSSLNAVMGPSGCGKTSLMKCLNKSNKFVLSPDSKIFVWKSSEINSAFVCQNQSQRLIFGLTVGQSLTYASQLKNSSVNGVNHKAVVRQVMAELLIEDIEQNRIDKCSGGQLKRVCIGLELTALNKPDFLFLDEPTTGLDSNAAQVVIECLRSVAVNHNICVICSIHQPNEELFRMFDKIYVMARGGHQLYSGPPQRLRHYLSELDIKVNDNEIPIEILLKYSSLGIIEEKVRQMNEKCLEQTNREYKEYSEENMRLTSNGLKCHPKAFNSFDTLTLLRRQFRLSFRAQIKQFIIKLNILFLMNVFMVILFDSRNGQYDGCASLNNDNKTCSQIQDDKSYLFNSTSFLGVGIYYMIIAQIMLMAPLYIDQYTVFCNEYKNG